jgi:hypothetical protein
MDPLTIGLVAGGAQALGGALQSIFSGRKKRQRDLESYAKQSPLYTPNKAISDYYQQAANRYNENPYQSALYKEGQRNIQRSGANALSAFQSRGSALGGAARVALGQDSALSNLGVQAEAQRNARFGQLGQAAQAKSSEDYRAFDINKMTPYNRQLQLKQLAAQAANDRYNSGLSMAAQGVGNMAQAYSASKYNPGTSGINPTGAKNNLTNPVFMGNQLGASQYGGYGVQPDGSYVNFGSYKPKMNPFTNKPF